MWVTQYPVKFHILKNKRDCDGEKSVLSSQILAYFNV